MKIVGHRGAAGLALENTIESIQKALELKVDAIEFDVRRTKDDQLVLCHDKNTENLNNASVCIRDSTYKDLCMQPLKNGEYMPSAEDALKAISHKMPVIIDVKESGTATALINTLRKFPKHRITLTGYQHNDMKHVVAALPEVDFFISEHFSPIEIVHEARRIGASGISLNAWLLNPLTYTLAKRYKLKIMLYTVNRPWVATFLKRFYPDILVCSDRPDKLL